MKQLDPSITKRLTDLALALIDQDKARPLIRPNRDADGFWFGGGNAVEDRDGVLYYVGRYRNYGDSRKGLAKGERGLKLAILRSTDKGKSFQEILSFSKADLSPGKQEVLSIEGAGLLLTDRGVELYVSSEKANLPYPEEVRSYLKPGTGVWTIDVIEAPSIPQLDPHRVRPFYRSMDPGHLHIKDPFFYQTGGGDTVLLFCTHPFNWTSHNTAYMVRRHGTREFEQPIFDFFPRGTTWDVAMTRGTSIVRVPQVGALKGHPQASLFFYDGGESLRKADEHERAVRRPRGYSCEELGGAAYFLDDRLDEIHRLSTLLPLFVSPWGTGCSRYVDVLSTEEGFYATWQQSQKDLSQPLVMNFLSHDHAAAILT